MTNKPQNRMKRKKDNRKKPIVYPYTELSDTDFLTNGFFIFKNR